MGGASRQGRERKKRSIPDQPLFLEAPHVVQMGMGAGAGAGAGMGAAGAFMGAAGA